MYLRHLIVVWGTVRRSPTIFPCIRHPIPWVRVRVVLLLVNICSVPGVVVAVTGAGAPRCQSRYPGGRCYLPKPPTCRATTPHHSRLSEALTNDQRCPRFTYYLKATPGYYWKWRFVSRFLLPASWIPFGFFSLYT